MNHDEFIMTMSKFIARKERLVEAFIATISDLDFKSCDKIENNLYEIIKETRGLIYADQYRQKTDKQSNSILLEFPISYSDVDARHMNTTIIPQQEKKY
jgi:hypothetical protein